MSLAKALCLDDVRYSAWANQRLLDGCAALTIEEIERDLGISHDGILATFRHIYDAERVWLECLRTNPAFGPWRLPQGPAPELSLDAVRQSWPEIWDGYRRLIEAMSEADLSQELIVQLPGEVEPSLPRWKVLHHALNHSNFHRGQIVGMIRTLEHCPPALNRMDYFQI